MGGKIRMKRTKTKRYSKQESDLCTFGGEGSPTAQPSNALYMSFSRSSTKRNRRTERNVDTYIKGPNTERKVLRLHKFLNS